MAFEILADRSRKTMRARRGSMMHLFHLGELLGWDTVKLEDDFLGDTLRTDVWAVNSDAGATDPTIQAGVDHGIVRLVSGTTDNERSYITGGLNWSGEFNAVIAVRLALSAITTVKVEVGFNDALTEAADSGIVNVLATPTATATDAVCWVLDTDDNGNWQGFGVDTDTVATKLEPTSLGNANGDAAPVAATYETLVVALEEGNARFLRCNAAGDVTYDSRRAGTDMTSAVTSTVNLTPWVLLQNRSTSSRNLDIDFIYVWQQRAS